jgi:hypothetical protein
MQTPRSQPSSQANLKDKQHSLIILKSVKAFAGCLPPWLRMFSMGNLCPMRFYAFNRVLEL